MNEPVRITIRSSAIAVVLPERDPAEGRGRSKRAAEQAAAAALLAREGVRCKWLKTIRQRIRQTRCGFVALIGAPNAGKSTLINALVRSKVSIVSHKVQTTRMPVRGIIIEGASQLIFVDTPGIFAPKRRLDRAMVTSAWAGAKDADLTGLLIDARKGLDAEAEAIVKKLVRYRRPQIPDPQQGRRDRQAGFARACDRAE